jgi:hypothetical protein
VAAATLDLEDEVDTSSTPTTSALKVVLSR